MEAVWGDVAVTDDSLVQCLVEIRKVLGEDSVTTQRGRGYRFERPVRLAGTDDPFDTADVRAGVTNAAPAPVAVSDGASRRASPDAPRTRSAIALWGVAGVAAIAVASAFVVTRDAPPAVATVGESTNAEARRAVLAGQSVRRRGSRTEMVEALAHFERAVTLDPGYAAAHVGISRTLTSASVFGAVRPADVGARARSEAERAIALDPTLADAYVALGHSQVQHEWDWAGAEASYRKAIALDPSNATAHLLYAQLLGALGRFDESLRENGRGLTHPTPERPSSGRSLRGILLYWARQPEASIEELRAAIEAEPGRSLPHFWLALSYAELGRFDEAMRSALASREAMGNQPVWVVGYVHARAGRRSEALTVLHALQAQAGQTYVPATDMALLHVGLGDHEAALDWLERGVVERSHWMELLAVHPVLDPLRREPRFQRLLQTLALPASAPDAPRDGSREP